MFVMQVAMLAGLGLVVGRILYVQHAYGKRLTAAELAVQQGQGTLLAPRGALLDAEGQPLAYDVPAFMFDFNRQTMANKAKFAALIAKPLGVPASQILPLLSGTGWVQWPHPILDPAKMSIEKAVQQAKPGTNIGAYITFTPTEERSYPDGSLAANTLGYVNSQGIGQAGLEEEYNSYLSGTNGAYSYTAQGNGEPIESSIHMQKAAKAGDNVELNINGAIQGFVEEQMKKINAQYHPEHATIIVMRPQTGAVLAMSSSPSFNPNHYWTASPLALSSNWAVNASFEPGSTFKIITLSAALATHTVSLNTIVPSGSMNVDGVTIHDWNYWGWSLEGPNKIDVAQALEKSSNVGMGTVALKLGWPKLLHYMQNFGFLAPTGIDLPGESSSDIFPPSEQGPVQLATSGFGQGIAVTPLQQMAALGAILNGGNVMKPEVAKAIINPVTGKVVKQIKPQVTHAHVIPASVAQSVKNTMIVDVNKGGQGIDQIAYIPGYEVGGKSGTAQIVNRATGQYYNNHYSVAFIGFAPGWNPQVEVYVEVYYPHNVPPSNTWGSTISGPVARAVLQECMQLFHIAPRTGHAVNLQTSPGSGGQQTRYVSMPSITGLSVSAAKQAVQQAGLTADVIGSGTVAKQWPQAGVSVLVGSTAYLLPSASSGGFLMPKLLGVPMREAGDILAALGVDFLPNGNGYAVSQSVPPGTKLHPGETVQVTFQQP